jgi:hypothetical protein
MTRRLRNFLHQISAAEAKKNKPEWVLKLPWVATPSVEATPPAAQEKANPEDYFFGWNSELRLAFRVKHDDPKKHHDLSNAPTEPPESQGRELMTATWDDGMVWNIAGLTVEKWRAKCEANRRPKQEQLWEGTHHSSHNKLLLSQRTDRGLLLSFFEQGRQICSVPVKLFGPLPEPQPGAVPKNNETLQKAVDFLTPLCEGYATGQIADGVELKKIRDEKLKELQLLGRQISTRPKEAKKKPSKQYHITSQLPLAEQSLPAELGAGMKRETNKKGTGVDKHTLQGAASSSSRARFTPSDAEFPMPLDEEAFLAFNRDALYKI